MNAIAKFDWRRSNAIKQTVNVVAVVISLILLYFIWFKTDIAITGWLFRVFYSAEISVFICWIIIFRNDY